ncbi:DUF4832 domain-containing protein [Terriglobus albidus]|uniref:DUF4832 domain-containing protein n=1 Tax=Terriglobus albidus TaxID=1592106 RepID=UPI0021E0900E|nr:DUF4832 domain-containing protein [Terriglobus albidus]
MRVLQSVAIGIGCILSTAGAAAQTIVIKPVESDRVLTNPGIGFTTFQRFNGDKLNSGTGWTEGSPIESQPLPGATVAPGYPKSTVAYLRLYWKFLEPEKGRFDWSLLDRALETAQQRRQTLMLRIAPHGSQATEDVPGWYRKETGEHIDAGHRQTDWQSKKAKWLIDPEQPAYAREYGAMIRALGKRYDGDPRLESVDISLLAAWGEGAGSDLLSGATRTALIRSYTESFHRTPLLTQLADAGTVAETLAAAHNGGAAGSPDAPVVGWRADCLGDMGGFDPKRNLMTDSYPEAIVGLHLDQLWKTAPVAMESCWVMQHWKDQGWDLKYIAAQAEKWHVSTFNNKSSAVPEEWWPQVNEWLRHMGYRFALRRFAYPSRIGSDRTLKYESWWENKGNAPVYRPYRAALQLTDGRGTWVIPLPADVRSWLPGDIVQNGTVTLPQGIPSGEYRLAIALIDPIEPQPRIHLAVEGENSNGWFPLGSLFLEGTPSTNR